MGKLQGNLVRCWSVILSKYMSFFWGWMGVFFVCVGGVQNGRCSVIKQMILWYLFLLYTEIRNLYLFFCSQKNKPACLLSKKQTSLS